MKVSYSKTDSPQVGRAQRSQSRTATAVCPKDSGGDKNPTNHKRKKKEKSKKNELYIATYNIRTMRLEDRQEALERELSMIKWNVVGLCETRLAGEQLSTTKSGHLMFQNNEDTTRQGGVALLIHKDIKHLVTRTKAMSSRVIYIVMELNPMYKIKIILPLHTQMRKLSSYTKISLKRKLKYPAN